MKGTKFFGIGAALAACVLALLLTAEAGFVSVAWAGKPLNPPTSTTKYGYAMFRDESQDVIQSDGRGQYIDCNNGGEDKVEINMQKNGSINYVKFYPGRIQRDYPTHSPSTRSVKFLFNVSNIPVIQPTPVDILSGSADGVHDILRWYRDKDGSYKERCKDSADSATLGFIDDKSLHTPVCVHSFPTDRIQFVIDPNAKPDVYGTDPKAITLEREQAFYTTPDDDGPYWYTYDEPANYIVYNLDYGSGGFVVKVAQTDPKTKKPVTWTISAIGKPVRLFVWLLDLPTEIELMRYPDGLPFEFAVSLNPLTSYVKAAPRKDSTLSSPWGEIKAK